jgi:hypothetical protein
MSDPAPEVAHAGMLLHGRAPHFFAHPYIYSRPEAPLGVIEAHLRGGQARAEDDGGSVASVISDSPAGQPGKSGLWQLQTADARLPDGRYWELLVKFGGVRVVPQGDRRS